MPNTLNEEAQKRFIALRHKLKLDIQKPILEEGLKLTQEAVDKMSDVTTARIAFNDRCNYADKAVEEVDSAFNYIDSLQLPPKLSLAIGLIISSNKTNNKEDIAKAVVVLGEYCNDN